MSALKLKDISSSNAEFIAFKNSFQFQDWYNQTQSVIQATGVSKYSIKNKNEKTSVNSMAYRLGHKTVGEFLTSKDFNNGLSINWNHWDNQAEAYQYKSKYAIYENNIDQVIKQVQDVEKALGSSPSDASEYHKVKEDILIEQRRKAEVKHQGEIREHQSKIKELQFEIDGLCNQLNKKEEVIGTLFTKEDMDKLIQEIEVKNNEVHKIAEELKVLKSNNKVNYKIDVRKLLNNYEETKSFLNKFREQNKQLKAQVKELTKEVSYLTSTVESQRVGIANSSKLSLMIGSLFFVVTSMMFLFLVLK